MEILTARWIPDIPTPEAVDQITNDTGMVELVPEIQNFNIVSVKPKKKPDVEKALIVGSAVAPAAACMATAEMMLRTPLTYYLFAAVSIGWNVLVLMANVKRKNRHRGQR